MRKRPPTDQEKIIETLLNKRAVRAYERERRLRIKSDEETFRKNWINSKKKNDNDTSTL